MSIFKSFSTFFKPSEKKTLPGLPVEEEKEGRVYVFGDKIFRRSEIPMDNYKIKIKSIAFVYVVKNEHPQSTYLYILEKWAYMISIDTVGFSEMYAKLSKKLKFDDAVFLDVIQQSGTQKKQLYRQIKKKNYRLTDGSYDDYAKGFEVLAENEKIFVDWNATKEDLNKNRYACVVLSDYGQEVLWFSCPIRIGNIVIESLEGTLEPFREGMPMSLDFYAACYDDSNSSVSYDEIKSQLQKDFASEGQQLNYERDDQNSFTFKPHGMEFSLVYDFDSDHGYDRGCTFFKIKNNRDFSALVINNDEEQNIEISDFLLFGSNVSMKCDYKTDKHVIHRPSNLLPDENDRTLVWIDKPNNKLGFAGDTYCMVFRMDEISHFSFQNILPAKFEGYADLRVHFAGREEFKTVMRGECHAFDDVSKRLSELTGFVMLQKIDELNS